jgi:hypothetical protein
MGHCIHPDCAFGLKLARRHQYLVGISSSGVDGKDMLQRTCLSTPEKIRSSVQRYQL